MSNRIPNKLSSIFLLIFLFFQIIEASNTNNIIILDNDTFIEKTINNIESKIFYINGSLSENKKYLLISSTNDITDNNSSISKSPLLFISKNENDSSYDYTSISQSTEFGNKIALPYSYLDSNGFYLNITCEILCEKNYLKIETIDEIDLEIGEKFSYYSKDKLDTFIININLNNYNYNDDIENIVFIVNGGEPKQLSMWINGIRAKKAFGDIYFVSMSLDEIKNIKNIKVEIKVGKNVKFNFETFLIYNDEDIESNNKYIYEGEYNQYLAIKGNRSECFNVQILNEEDKSKSLEIPREILILGTSDFQVNIFCDKKGETNKIYFEREDDIDDYVISDGLNCQSSVKEICIKSSSDDLDIVQIHIHKRINEGNNNENIRKMNEPLLNGITYKYTLEEENSEDTTNKHINLHSHSYFYEKNLEKKDIIGLNVGIEVLYGIIKVYKDICETYPYCSLSKEKISNLIKNESIDSTFETINGEGGYYASSIFSYDDTYSMNTKQNIIIVLCKDSNFDGCAYEITYYNMDSYKTLFSGGTITKYLPYYNLNNLYPKTDKYELILHKDKKIVLDLVVYSGDAYITMITQKDGCVFEEYHLGSNERRIITCSNNDVEYDRILFDVKANNNAAFYTIYALEKEINNLEDSWPMEMTIMESIHESQRIIKVLGKYLNDPPRKATSNFATIFNSLNCDLNVYNLNTSMDYTSEDNDDIIQDVTKAAKRIDLFYEVKKNSDFHSENKNCLYFVSSFDMNNEDSSFIIPEAKPFRFKLDSDTDILRVNFPYAVNDDEKNKIVFLRVNLLNNIPIKIIIQVGFLPPEEHILYYSKNINVISNKDILRKNNFVKIIITIKTVNKYDEAIIDFSIRTNSPIPYSIKTEKYFSDLTLSNNTQYYMTLIKQNSEGEILVNFKRNKGTIYAKLVREDKLREVSGWGDRYITPNNKIDQRLLLPFNPYTQKVYFSKKETNNCDKYCYLLFGIDANDNLNLDSEDNKDSYFIPYNLYFKYFDENENNIKFIDLQNNEYITNYLNLNKDDYYYYHIYDFFINENITKVIIDFDSENCELLIGFNTNNFSDPEHTKILTDKNSSSTKFEISKEEIIKYYDNETDKDEYSYDLYLYLKIYKKPHLSNLLDINELDLLYTLRANSPNTFAEGVNIINNIQPNNCHFTDKKKYCDYLMKLESFNPQIIIELFALSNNYKKIYIFANAISSDDFGKYMNNYELPEWPNNYNDRYDFPEDNQKNGNYLSINYSQIISKLNNSLDPLLLIRVYGEPNSDVKILSSMHNSNKNNENIVIPFINRNQLYSVEKNKTLFINLPKDDEFICKLIPIKGKGNITYHNKKYILEGNYEPLVFNTVKNEDNTLTIESIDYSPSYTTDNFPFEFSLIFSKMKKSGTNEVFLGSNNFAYENIKLPMNYYVDVTNLKNNDLSFDVFLEDFGYIYNDNEVTGTNSKLKNYTEDFNIKGYLLTEEELNDVLNNNKKLNDDNLYPGSFDLTHKSGNVHIPKEKINDFIIKNNNKKLYLYTTINKAYNNRNNYSFLKGKINLILPDNPSYQIPYDTYILGYIKGNVSQAKDNETINHKYKLNLASINTENKNTNNYLKVEFTSVSNDSKINLVDSSSKDKSNLIEKIHHNMDDYGKDIYIVKPNKVTEDLFLSIESPVKEYDKEYTFKYSLLNNNKGIALLKEYPYIYEPKIIKCNISNTSNSYIKFKKIQIKDYKNNKTKNCNCNYYINIYKKNKNSNNKNLNNNTISIKKTELPYATYKISNDSPDDFLEANVHIYTDEEFYYEIIGEDKDTKELFGYYKKYPEKDSNEEEQKTDEEEQKKGNGFDWALLILIILGIILIIITLCLCCKFCCNSKEKKNRKRKKDNFKMNIERHETLYKNDLLPDDN